MKKYMLLGLFVFCIVSFTLMFNVKTTLSVEIVCNNFAYGDGSTVHADIMLSDSKAAGDAASVDGYKLMLSGNGGKFTVFQTLEKISGSDVTYSTLDIQKDPSEQDRPNHLAAKQLMTTTGVEVLGEDRMKIYKVALGNGAFVYSGSQSSSIIGYSGTISQAVSAELDGSVIVAGRAASSVYSGPDHGGSISSPAWTQENATKIESDYAKFDWKQSGKLCIFQGEQMLSAE